MKIDYVKFFLYKTNSINYVYIVYTVCFVLKALLIKTASIKHMPYSNISCWADPD